MKWFKCFVAISDSSENLEGGTLGLIFACYMVCIMIGSTVFSIGMRFYHGNAEILGRNMLILAVFSMLVPVFFRVSCC